MKIARSVLLVHNEPDAFRGLEEMLHEQEVGTCHAHHCAEAQSMLREADAVDLVLTDVALADGTWKDVSRLVRKLAKDAPVPGGKYGALSGHPGWRRGGFRRAASCARDLAYIFTGAMQRTVPP